MPEERRKKKPFVLGRLINAMDPERDIKLLAFGAVVAAAIFWLTREQGAGPITDKWVDAFFGLCALVGLGGGAWSIAENWKGKNVQTGTTITKSSQENSTTVTGPEAGEKK